MPFRDGLSDDVFVPLYRDVLGRAVDAYQVCARHLQPAIARSCWLSNSYTT